MNVKVGDRLFLSCLSQHARKFLEENGNVFVVIDIKDKVLACRNKPGFLVESMTTKCWKWVAVQEDREFLWNLMLDGKNRRY